MATNINKWLCVTTEVKLHCKVVFVSFYSNADYEGTHKHDDWYTIAIAFTCHYYFIAFVTNIISR